MHLVFVTPWFLTDRPGGAERLVASYARELKKLGCKVTVATTTSKSPADNWGPGRDNLPEGGSEWEQGITVRRFKCDKRYARVYRKLDQNLRYAGQLELEEERLWVRNSIQSDALLEWLGKSDDIDAILVAPYPFGLSFSTIFGFSDKAFLIPCLHAEGYARLAMTCEMIIRAKGLIFNAPEEAAFTQSLVDIPALENTDITLPQSLVVAPPISIAPDSDETIGESEVKEWRQERLGGRPFVLSLGKQTSEKGIPDLLHLFAKRESQHSDFSAQAGEIVLALAGSGGIASEATSGVVDLGYLSDHEKWLALSAAEWLIQSSPNESFSYVMMEAWQMSTPVLVSGASPVAAGHVSRSRGGLIFRNADEFSAILQGGLVSSEEQIQFGENGKAYVRQLQGMQPAQKVLDFVKKTISGEKRI